MLSSQLSTALKSRTQRQINRNLPQDQSNLVDFTSNDYLSLSSSSILRDHFLAEIQKSSSNSSTSNILGSGGSRLLVHSTAHAALEQRLATFFRAPSALLFNSGFDANVGIFSCLPQPGDAVVYDEYIHASVHDGIRMCRADKAFVRAFSHNSMSELYSILEAICQSNEAYKMGKHSVFLAVESLYSMDGTFAPLSKIIDMIELMFPLGNAYLIVDEAHATGIYGHQGRGIVAQLGLEKKVLVRLHTFGKALAATGAVVLTSDLIKRYLINYARSLIYTTSISPINILAAGCSFDLLEDGTAQQLASTLLSLSAHLISTLHQQLAANHIPQNLVRLPSHLTCSPPPTLTSPIIPLFTPNPRSLSSYLLSKSINARPITWPTVPKGKERVRVCLHSRNTAEQIDLLVEEIVMWARKVMQEERKKMGVKVLDGFMESKL